MRPVNNFPDLLFACVSLTTVLLKMNARDLRSFKILIEARQKELSDTDNRSSTGMDAVELDQSKVGRLSRMDAMQIQEMNLEAERRRTRELIALNHALSRIESGNYGICTECDEDINPKRLEIDPVAVLCINCANKLEQSA